MKCSVYIASSLDGYIAKTDGNVEWLQKAGNHAAEMGSKDMGFQDFLNSVDCIVMGRKTMEVISSMNLKPDQWPYGELRVVVLSSTLKEPPENLKNRVEIFNGEIENLVKKLETDGCNHAYIDGGSTITAFLNLKLIDHIFITIAPVLLGEGIPLFGRINHDVSLIKTESEVYNNDFVQLRYEVKN